MVKAYRAPFPKKVSSRETRLFKLVHSDVNGPIEVTSTEGFKYFIAFMDDYSRWTVVYTMKAKSESFECF